MGWRRNHPAEAPRGAAQPLMEGDKGSDAFLQQKMQLFLSATGLRTAVQTVPLPFPPLCPLRAQTTFNSRVVCGFVIFLALDVLSILTTTTRSLQLYHLVQAVARPCKTASSVEMVCGQCQQEGRGSCKRDRGEVCELPPALSRAVGVRKSCEVLLVDDCCFTSSGWSCGQGHRSGDSLTYLGTS